MVFFRRQSRFLWLIFSSLALLALFQVFWLRKVWQEQREALELESNYIFQQTVTALQDSLVRRNMVEESLDTGQEEYPPVPPPPLPGKWEVRRDTEAVIALNAIQRQRFPDSSGTDHIQIFIKSDDSLNDVDPSGAVSLFRMKVIEGMQNLPSGAAGDIPNWNGMMRKFSFRVSRDTLSADSLRIALREALQQANMPLDFRLVTSAKAPAPAADVVRTKPSISGMLTHQYYAAEFPVYNGYLLRKILPHLLFSLLLFGVTAVAFLAIYRSLRQQQRLTTLKNDFIGNITHELKTPITTVGVALEALSDFDVLGNPDQTREYLSISKLELERLTLLVDKVLRLSMFEEKQPRLKSEPVDLAALTRQVLNAMKLQAEHAGVDVRFEASENGAFMVNGDRLHLTSVVFNLIDNALKYRQNEKPALAVSLQNLPENNIRLTVRDNGIGIAPEYQARIFDKFFRVPSGNTHNVKGHGLGLSYVANVVRQHGGTIRVESGGVGEGTAFVVEMLGT
jgi:two-component system phosphate regulon sensor histidine kinase PhoR